MGEPSIDAGGPRREFFRLLPHHAATTLLRGERRKFFSMNVKAFQVRKSLYFSKFVFELLFKSFVCQRKDEEVIRCYQCLHQAK